MNSLRARLILGSALIALVPLAAAMLLLTQRIEGMVREQAAGRLAAALGGLDIQVREDAARVDTQLRILARDPQLRRLYLVRPVGGRDLAEYLVERRTLLGLDFLRVADTSGQIVAAGGPEPGVAAGPATVAVSSGEPILYQGTAEGTLHGGRFIDRAYLAHLERAAGIELMLHDPVGRPVATTLSGSDSAATAVLSAAASGDEVRRLAIGEGRYVSRDMALAIGPPPHPRLTGLVSTAAAERTIAAVQWTSIVLGALGLVLAIALGFAWSSQVSRPVERLAAFSERVARGAWDEPLALRSVRELETLGVALDRMRSDLRAYRERLVTSERQAAWGQMARTVAHEVANPLTPISVSIADLRRSYAQQHPEFPRILDQAVRTIGEEVETLRRMLQDFADLGRMPPPTLAQLGLATLFADLETLYGREVAAGRLAFGRPDENLCVAADASQMRRALVNLIKNGLEALDGSGEVRVTASVEDERVVIAIADTGRGLTEPQRALLFTPGLTTKPEGSGLGLTIVQRIVHEHGGSIAVESAPGTGTTFRVHLPLSREA